MELHEIPTDGSRAYFAPVLPSIPDNGNSVARVHFESLSELAAMIPPTAPSRVPENERHHWTKNDETFYGLTKTMRAALDLARNGWKEGAERARPLLERVNVARPVRKAMVKWSVAGGIPSVPRYLSGDPMHMRTTATAPTNKQPVITLISSTSAPWYVKPEHFEFAAVAAAAIIDRLEDAGFRVEVIAGRRESSDSTGTTSRSGENNARGHRSEMWFRLKAAQDTLDLDRLVFGLGHPAVHRRLLFAAGAMHPAYKKSLGSWQGYAVSLDKLEHPVGTYVLPSMLAISDAKHKDAVATFDAAIASLKKQGCPGLE
jgi:hypothetical protein